MWPVPSADCLSSPVAVPTTRRYQSGGGGSTGDGTVPDGPEKIAPDAQAATVDAGETLCKEELAKRSKNPLDMWDEMIARSDNGIFPPG